MNDWSTGKIRKDECFKESPLCIFGFLFLSLFSSSFSFLQETACRLEKDEIDSFTPLNLCAVG
jgi:hypothetical protein